MKNRDIILSATALGGFVVCALQYITMDRDQVDLAANHPLATAAANASAHVAADFTRRAAEREVLEVRTPWLQFRDAVVIPVTAQQFAVLQEAYPSYVVNADRRASMTFVLSEEEEEEGDQ